MPKNNRKSTNSSKKLTTEDKIREIENEYKYFQKNTEEHVDYTIQWKMYWNRRYSEIKREGKFDPNTYDYKIDWIDYWMHYLKDYYENKINFYRKQMKSQSSPINISSSSSESLETSNKNRRYRRIYSTDSTHQKSREKHIERLSSISSTSFSDEEKSPGEKHRYENTTLLSVCRMLSVLDAELGSLLSNKIMDLVAQIIELEKIHANSSEEVLMTNENATFLGTVKEKLKGLIFTNLLDTRKIPVAKKCIQDIAQLIHQYPTKIQDCEETAGINDTSIKLEEIITKALVTFGKTDVSPEELDVITEIYLEELDKNIELASTKSDDKCEKAVQSSGQKDIPFENLSDDELKILIKNFTQLSDEEQHHMITFITQIEEKEPDRVRNLETFINQSKTIAEDDDEDYNFDELIAKINS